MRLSSGSAKDTLALGKSISKFLRKGDIVCLYGELGCGKTVLTKGIAQGMGIDKDSVISPTFVLIRQYYGRKLSLCHFDLYRLRTSEDILGLGYEDYLYNEAVSVIEWADKLGCLLPPERLDIYLSSHGIEKRMIKLCASGARYQDLLEKIHEVIGH